jgi:hypothetical protein
VQLSELPLSEVLARSAAEARELALMAGRLDDAIGSMALTGHAGGPTPGWQEADLLRQSLHDLARFFDALRGELPGHITVDTAPAAHGLDLRDLAGRLTAAPGMPAPPTPAAMAADGEAELF